MLMSEWNALKEIYKFTLLLHEDQQFTYIWHIIHYESLSADNQQYCTFWKLMQLLQLPINCFLMGTI